MSNFPEDQGLYSARNEHDNCGVGAVANIDGRREHKIVDYAKKILLNLHHRGAAAADEVTGDGAGILMQIPYEFLKDKTDFEIAEESRFAAGMVFLPKDEARRNECCEILSKSLDSCGIKISGWRDVPVCRDSLAEIALSAEPEVMQVFLEADYEPEEYERKLYLARRRAENGVKAKFPDIGDDFYICSLSCSTICYKGMFMAHQLFSYYPDLSDKNMKTAIAVVHQRYSTNTFPSWPLAQPFRYMCHNGEINTLHGNRNNMKAREYAMESDYYGEDIKDLFPVLEEDASDSATFDNCLELLSRTGRSLPHSLMMMVPEAFGQQYHMSTYKRAFYEYHASIIEPWDGPAAILFTDGKVLGGTLDRNGLRPCRYVVTEENTVIMASEVGVIEFAPEKIRTKGRLQPGKMFLVDTEEQRIITDNEIKSNISRAHPYRRWLANNRIELRGLFSASSGIAEVNPEDTYQQLRCFGYTKEEFKMVIEPMAVNGQEPVGSMGNDAALSFLSDMPKSVFTYFKQRFAQVTNPPIDPLREGLVMSTMQYIGRKRNLLSEDPKHCKQVRLPHPLLTNDDMKMLRKASREDFAVSTVEAVFDAEAEDPGRALSDAIDKLINDIENAIKQDDASIIIISDKGVSERRAPIPALLAVSAAHHGMLKRRLRGQAALVLESGEPREVNHFCLLSAYGVDAVNPYLLIEAVGMFSRTGEFSENLPTGQLLDNLINAVKKGILKTMSKMGISTIRSYRSAQLYEAVGLNTEMVDKYFCGTDSRIEGVGLEHIAAETIEKHRKAYKPDLSQPEIDFGGDYHYRLQDEKHGWTPKAITRLQHAVMGNDKAAYDDFAKEVNENDRNLCTIRSLFKFKKAGPIDISKVEPAEKIAARFCTGAMSHGSISREAHECLAIAMNRIGGMSNTGEGGEDPKRYQLDENGDDKNCRIKQVASGRFGVTINYLAHAKEIQIKMAQGAKPGEGGHLPGRKVTEEIAKLRNSMPGVSLISPPPHHDIYSIEDLAQLIYDLKCSNPGAKVSVKLVSEVGVGTVAAGVAKGNADEVLISGGDGGSGATPLSSIKYAGAPWELGLAETQQTLVLNGLRDRIRVQTDGQLRTGRDVVIAAMLGADQYGFGTSALVSLGCLMMRKCHLGTCPAGIATQDPELRKCFIGKAENLVNYMMFVAEEVRQILADLGARSLSEVIGRCDLLEMNEAIEHWKAKGVDLTKIFYKAEPFNTDISLTKRQTDKLKGHSDWELIEMVKDSIETGKPVVKSYKTVTQNRTLGTILSNTVVNKWGPSGLKDNTFTFNMTGSGGQSFGAFLAKGITLRLEGDANDYLGKGLSGGRIIVKTPEGSPFIPHENIIVGNTLLYGATSGEVFINGVAGERFCVRNSGASAVVEGVGDHGCEYMTNGMVVVLGKTGCNFAAGMSGGIAYVFDEAQLFDTRCNLDMVDIEFVHHQEDKQRLYDLITKHYEETGSERAEWILSSWRDMVGRFVKVMPVDYRKALERIREREERQNDNAPATEEVYNG
ncbi:glutamate synthase large subunit [Sedimentisphaera salicampi]|uniref:glutamate synthase large subunit n=1 Tax=Sedimentisphaera salicampi TaxID=1941349 RepID=UPI000B9C3216|nr:glutamate synthase large subunit [Sedimentisphaera salicampi]OXU14791.1 Ferredoxin-dependent glutamate synthase 1 [Sedimentisphaera salicampi]